MVQHFMYSVTLFSPNILAALIDWDRDSLDRLISIDKFFNTFISYVT